MSEKTRRARTYGLVSRLPGEEWRKIQAQRLGRHLEQAAKSVLYRDVPMPAAKGIHSGNLAEIVRSLPVTTKDQLAAAGSGAHCAKAGEIAEWVCTSGTLGKPLDVPLTRSDMNRIAENEAEALHLAGVREGDLVVLGVGMERMFVAGMAYWLGARRLGATRVRVGPRLADQPGMLRELAERVGAKGQRVFVIAVPSYLVNVERVEGLAGIIAIGEPVRDGATLAHNRLGLRLWERFGCPVMSTYASTETCTTFAEGPECRGGHLNPELAIVEVLDEAGLPVGAGEVGEVVVTPLGVEGMPLVRFGTGDMAAMFEETCVCGRTTPRLGPIVGRKQQLLKVRGVSVYPGAIVEALRGMAGVVDCLVVAEEEMAGSDRLTVYVQGERAAKLAAEVDARLRAALRVAPEVRFIGLEEMKGLQQSGGRKVARFIDRRGNGK